MLGVSPGATADELRASYLDLVRRLHPDVIATRPEGSGLDDDARTLLTANVTAAYAALQSALRASPDRRIPSPSGDQRTAAEPGRAAEPTVSRTRDVIAVDAPPATTFALLYEAAGRVGNVAYYDRQLGILEIIVRFEGGPSCSVLMTLQQHARDPRLTEIVCSMESIEAAPTPPIAPVIDELVHELTDA